MGRAYTATRSYSADPGAVVGHMPAAFESIDSQVESSDAASGTTKGSKGVRFLSCGERVSAQVSPADGGSTVTVESKLKFGLIDWGNNKRNVEGVLASLSKGVG